VLVYKINLKEKKEEIVLKYKVYNHIKNYCYCSKNNCCYWKYCWARLSPYRLLGEKNFSNVKYEIKVIDDLKIDKKNWEV